jgi:hypothetical protein
MPKPVAPLLWLSGQLPQKANYNNRDNGQGGNYGWTRGSEICDLRIIITNFQTRTPQKIANLQVRNEPKNLPCGLRKKFACPPLYDSLLTNHNARKIFSHGDGR